MNPHSRYYVPAVVGALPAALPLPPAGFNPRSLYSDYGNPFYADTGSLGMEVPAPWDRWYCYGGSRFVQRPTEEPVPVMSAAAVCDGGITRDDEKDSTRVPTKIYSPYDGYDEDIEATLRAQEREAKPSPDYLETTQWGRMSQDARAALVSWMKAFTRRYDDLLAPGTLHRAVSYADRFLSVQPVEDVGMHRLYLLGAAAVYAAAKYEDQAGTVQKLNAEKIARYYGRRSGDFASSKQQVLDMERALLVALDYRLGRPTAYTFVEHFTRHYGPAEVEQDLRSAAHDFADMSLLHYSCLEHNPSAVAAAAMFLARLTLKPSYGQITRSNRELRELTGYEPQKLKRCVEAIHSLIPQYGNGSYADIDLFPMFYAVAADPR